ncbi:MAG: DUF4136 domain-containing protein [Bacteroidales bacterium]|nr:DUF4136 domain-containing protein [Bacteroidales bacterium]
MQKKINYFIILSGIIILAYGCYPGGPEYYSDLDLVTTNYSPEFWDNNSPMTYFMPDSLGYIIDRDDPDNNDTISINDSDLILELVEENMTTLGYNRLDTIDEFNQPDLVLFSQVLVVKVTYGGYYPWYPWWDGYYPYWSGYWYDYYWGYIPVAYSFSVGTVILEMVDYHSIDTVNKNLDVVWVAGIDGLLRESSKTNEKVLSDQIDKAFYNSPYLNIQ